MAIATAEAVTVFVVKESKQTKGGKCFSWCK